MICDFRATKGHYLIVKVGELRQFEWLRVLVMHEFSYMQICNDATTSKRADCEMLVMQLATCSDIIIVRV